jgi:hypothetical protein
MRNQQEKMANGLARNTCNAHFRHCRLRLAGISANSDYCLRSLLKKYPADVDQARRALPAILAARQAGADNEPDWKAMALKLQGMALETIGQLNEALTV